MNNNRKFKNKTDTVRAELLDMLCKKPMEEADISNRFYFQGPEVAMKFEEVWDYLLKIGQIEPTGHYQRFEDDLYSPFYLAYSDKPIEFDQWCQENLNQQL